jgi:hypothetical protein
MLTMQVELRNGGGTETDVFDNAAVMVTVDIAAVVVIGSNSTASKSANQGKLSYNKKNLSTQLIIPGQ